MKEFFKSFSIKKLLKHFNPIKLIKLVKIKYIVIAAGIALVVAIIYFGIGAGIGNGRGDGKGNNDSNVQVNNESVVNPEQTQNANDDFKGAVLAVNVVGNDYFYDNSRVDMDSLLNTLSKIDGELVVKVKDDNASLRAYDSLIEALEEKGIRYVEE